jgi:AcrR family transcriptional regulator
MSRSEYAVGRSHAVQRGSSRSIRQVQNIIDAARRLIMEKGGAFTTRELAKEAGVAMQTLYRYFEGNDQLLLSLFEEMIADQVESYRQSSDDQPDPVARLRGYVLSTLATLDGGALDRVAARFITAEHWPSTGCSPTR